MIAVVEAELDARERERWRLALARAALVARPRPPMEIEILLVTLPLWSGPYLATLAMRLPSDMSVAVAIRALAAAAWMLVLRAALARWRAPRTSWVNGRYLYAWGYVEIEDGVLRAVPMDELGVEVGGRALGLGPLRMVLRADGWSRALWLAPSELAGLGAALDACSSLWVDDERRGYRDPAPRIAGASAAWPRSRRSGDLAWALVAAVVGVAVPAGLVPLAPSPSPGYTPSFYVPYANAEGLRSEYTKELASHGGPPIASVQLALEPCSRHDLVIETVESYLALALTRPRLGPARPSALPVFRPPDARARLWCRSSWEVDQVNGTFARAEARWGLDRDGAHSVERRATVDVSEVLDTIESCRSFEPQIALSPRGLAVASIALLRAVVIADVYRRPAPELTRAGESPPFAACLLTSARAIVVRELDPS